MRAGAMILAQEVHGSEVALGTSACCSRSATCRPWRLASPLASVASLSLSRRCPWVAASPGADPAFAFDVV
eukprot:4544984-Pyramimonas_sp.AAC.1